MNFFSTIKQKILSHLNRARYIQTIRALTGLKEQRVRSVIRGLSPSQIELLIQSLAMNCQPSGEYAQARVSIAYLQLKYAKEWWEKQIC